MTAIDSQKEESGDNFGVEEVEGAAGEIGVVELGVALFSTALSVDNLLAKVGEGERDATTAMAGTGR